MWNQCETIGIKFKDGKEFYPRPFGNKTQQLFLDIIKYLKAEKFINIIDYKEKKMSLLSKIGFALFCIFFFLLVISVTF